MSNTNAEVKEYIIIGDSKQYKDCLVYVCGASKEHAEDVLTRMLINPTENDKYNMKGLTNFRVQEVNSKDCWWNDPGLAN